MAKELISEEIVAFNVKAETKEDVIRYIVDMMDKDGRLLNADGYYADVLKREATSSTAIGFSIATPHAKSEHVAEPSLAFIRLEKPMKWDEEEVSMVFQIGVPSPGQGDRHLEILAMLFRNLVYDEFVGKLASSESEQDIVDMLSAI